MQMDSAMGSVRTRRGLLVSTAAAAGAAALAACGAAAATQAPAKVEGPVTLDMFYSNNTFGREPVMAAFGQQYPNITVNITPVGTFTDTQEKVFTAAAAGTMPDVFWSHGANTGTFGHKKLLRELDSLASRKTKDFDVSDYTAAATEMFKWNGKLYALPQEWDANLHYYNKALIQQAGLQDPAALEAAGQWTLAKFEEYCRALSRPNDAAPRWGTQEVPVDIRIQVPYLWIYGGDKYSKDFKEAVFNSPQALQGWEALTRQRLQNWAQAARSSVDLRDGKVAFINNNRRGVGSVLQDTAGSYGMVGMPVAKAGDKQTTRASTAGYGMAATTKQVDAAWLLVQFMGTTCNDMAVAQQATGPTRKSGWKSDTWLQSLRPWESAAVYERINGTVRAHFVPPGGVQVVAHAQEAYNQVVAGKQTLKTAFDEAKRLSDQTLREFSA